jgi:hypothetical protein
MPGRVARWRSTRARVALGRVGAFPCPDPSREQVSLAARDETVLRCERSHFRSSAKSARKGRVMSYTGIKKTGCDQCGHLSAYFTANIAGLVWLRCASTIT